MAAEKKSKSREKIRVFLLDDHPIVRQGLAQTIQLEKDMEVCGQAETVPDAVRQVAKIHPDVVIVDISLEGANGLEAIKRIKQMSRAPRTLVLSMHEETLYAERTLRAGANGYLMKSAPAEDITKAIRQVLAGEVYLSEAMSRMLLRNVTRRRAGRTSSPIERLTDREFEIFALIAEGALTKQIAEKLHLSASTVDTHKMHVREKLGLEDGSSLLQHAIEWAKGD